MYKFKVKCRFCDKLVSFNNFDRHLKGKNCDGLQQELTRRESIMEGLDDYSWGTLHLVEVLQPTIFHYNL